MGRTFLTVMAVWSLLAAPAMCRAGALLGCCGPASDEHTELADVDAGPCGCLVRLPVPPSAPASEDRCTSCGDLCGAPVKPADETVDTPIDPDAVATVLDEPGQAPRADGKLPVPHPSDRSGPRLPFPPSDVPLLI